MSKSMDEAEASDCDEHRESEDQVELGEQNKEVIEYWRKIWYKAIKQKLKGMHDLLIVFYVC